MAGSLTDVPLRLTYDEQMRLCVVLLIAAALAFLFLPKGDKEQKRRRFRPSRPKSPPPPPPPPPPSRGSKRGSKR